MYMRNRYSRRRCGCGKDEMECRKCQMPPVCPGNPQLANSYVPYQYATDTFCPKESLNNGTTFPELVSPYVQNQSQCIIEYLSQTETCKEVDDCGR